MKINLVDAILARLNEPLTILSKNHEIINYLETKNLGCRYYLSAKIELSRKETRILKTNKCHFKHPFFNPSKNLNSLPYQSLGKHYSILIQELNLMNKSVAIHSFKLKNNLIKCKLSYNEEWYNLSENELHFYFALEHIKSYYESIIKIVDRVIRNVELDDGQTKKIVTYLYTKFLKSLQQFKSHFEKPLEESNLKNLCTDDFRYLIPIYLQKLLRHIEVNYQSVLDQTVPIPMRSHLRKSEELIQKKTIVLQNISSLSSELIEQIALPFKHIKELEKCPNFSFSKAYYLINYLDIWFYFSSIKAITDLLAIDVAIRANLNSNQFISFSSEFIKNYLSEMETNLEKKLELHRYIKTVKQIPIQNKESYIPENKSLKKHILKWLKEELTFVDKVLEESVSLKIQTTDNMGIPPHEKLTIYLKVPEIALLFRLMVETNLIQTSTRTQIFDFITNNLKTETSEIISKSSIKNKFYSPEVNSCDTMKETLIKLLNVLNRNFN